MLCAASILATACSGAGDNIAVPITTTEQPRQIAEPQTTTSTTTTTTTEAPRQPMAEVHVLGSLRSVPVAASTDTAAGAETEAAESSDADDTEDDALAAASPAEALRTVASPVLAGDDATIASLACTRSSGCEPTDLAAWAANTLDVVNLATGAAGDDGIVVLDEYAAALLASGVATAGYGADLASAVEPAIVGDPEIPVQVFAISFAQGLPNDLIATESTSGIAAGDDAFAALVAALNASPPEDAQTVVIVDFGLLEDRAPSEDVSARVQVLVEAGADAVVVHGSDFLQRFERIANTAVAFSLGNAASTTTEPLRRDTAILRLVFEDETQNACLFPATGGESGVGMDDPSLTECP